MKSIVLSLILTLMLSLSCTTQASDQNRREISKQQAISTAQQANPGRVLAIERSNTTYRVKMLNANGEVRIMVVDAYTGKLLSKR